MSKNRRAITPWSHLSVAFDLCDRCPLPLKVLRDPRGRVARIWRFERFCRRVRAFAVKILVFSCAGIFAAALLAKFNHGMFELFSNDADFIFQALGSWFLFWIGAALLTFVAGFVLAPWRIPARAFMLLHAERLRRRNLKAVPAHVPSLAIIKNRLVTSSLSQELLSPLLLVAILSLLVVVGTLLPGLGGLGPAVLSVTAIPITIVFVIKASNSPSATVAKGIDLALRGPACPACQYSLAGAGPPALIRRCPECGMRFPRRLPVNFPTPGPSIWRKMGTAIRSRIS